MTDVVRSILSTNLKLPADDVIKQARTRGVTASDKSLRDTIYNLRSGLKKKAAKTASVPSAARATTAPKPAPAAPPVPDLSAVLSNVALVNTVVGACGGVEHARKVAEAVRACGGVDAFLQHLDLVAQVRGAS
jgi:hypothetical protein